MGKTIIQVVVGLGGYFMLRQFVSLETCMAASFAILFAVVIGCPIGLLVGYLMSRDSDVDTKAYRVIAWGNLVAWLVPVVGMTLSAATSRFSKRSDMSQRFYSTLGGIGGLLAAVNAGVGGGLAIYQVPSVAMDRAAVNAEMDRLAVTTERSFERCEFAAVEAWSEADFEKHCRRPPEPWRVRALERSLKARKAQSAG